MEILSEYHEEVLEFLLDLRRTANSQTFAGIFIQNSLSGREDYLTPKLFDALCSLHNRGYIIFHTATGNISGITDLMIQPKGLDYFENKQRFLDEKQKYEKREKIKEIRAWITLGIAIFGLVIAAITFVWQGIETGYFTFGDSEPSTTSTAEEPIAQ